jgi:hypothetical protein
VDAGNSIESCLRGTNDQTASGGGLNFRSGLAALAAPALLLLVLFILAQEEQQLKILSINSFPIEIPWQSFRPKCRSSPDYFLLNA